MTEEDHESGNGRDVPAASLEAVRSNSDETRLAFLLTSNLSVVLRLRLVSIIQFYQIQFRKLFSRFEIKLVSGKV